MTEDQRPAPDALLEAARKEGRGRLKIFLGAFPGVGKTYAMLQSAHARRKEGVDVVVGVAESHGRAETEALLRGLDVLPRKKIAYRGRVFGEMDIDAILWRKPKLAIVDELAHSNVSGSRHEKRWQDVEELLAAGIDVYSTLNIQHLESLNDVVARISKVQVRETVPDSVLELAEEIELVDLPSDDLIQRLREGKVYVPEQVGQAVRHFFSKGNLTALRELALRAAAERVDAQMLDYMRAHAVPGPWPAQDRIMVCVNESPLSKKLVRTARRMAERQRVPWIAVTVETPRHQALGDAARARTEEALRLAESLGGEAVTLHAESRVAEELQAFARKRNVSRLVIGQPRRRRWTGWFQENAARRLLDSDAPFEVTLVPLTEKEAQAAPIQQPLQPEAFQWEDYPWAVVAVGCATLINLAVWQMLPLPNVALVFITAVLVVAIRKGLWPSIFASLLGFISYNFFFTEPYHSLAVFYRHDLFTIVFFLGSAVIVGNLAARLKRQVVAMRTTVKRTEALYDFSRKIAAAATPDDVLWAAVHHVASTLQCRSLVLLPDKGGLGIAAGFPPEDQLSRTDWGAAEWAWDKGQIAGWRSDTLPSAEWLFLPLKTRAGIVGLLGVSFANVQQPLGTEQSRLLHALADQVAVAVERSKLAVDIEEARVLGETEELRAALLSSVSHDLRTPLVSIIGSATSLSAYPGALSAEDQQQLVQTILEESERLNRFVQNLLDMTRLGYGALQPRRDWVDLREISGRAVRQLQRELKDHPVTLELTDDLPMVYLDPVLIEQVLVNLIDNAAKYSRPGTAIAVKAGMADDQVVLQVADQGPGIPEDAREAVFDLFYRVRERDSQIAGTGLGLAICRGIIGAHGGTIRARAGKEGRGTAMEIRLPLADPPRTHEADQKAITAGAGDG